MRRNGVKVRSSCQPECDSQSCGCFLGPTAFRHLSILWFSSLFPCVRAATSGLGDARAHLCTLRGASWCLSVRSGTALIASLNTPKAPYLIQESFAFVFVVAVAVVLGFPRFPLIHRAYSCSSCFHDSCISCFLIRRGRGGPPLRTGGPLWDSGRSTVFYREVQKRCSGRSTAFLPLFVIFTGCDIPGSPPRSGGEHTGRSTPIDLHPQTIPGGPLCRALVARPDGSLLPGGPPKSDQFGRGRFRAQQWEVRSGPPGMTASGGLPCMSRHGWTNVYGHGDGGPARINDDGGPPGIGAERVDLRV